MDIPYWLSRNKLAVGVGAVVGGAVLCSDGCVGNYFYEVSPIDSVSDMVHISDLGEYVIRPIAIGFRIGVAGFAGLVSALAYRGVQEVYRRGKEHFVGRRSCGRGEFREEELDGYDVDDVF